MMQKSYRKTFGRAVVVAACLYVGQGMAADPVVDDGDCQHRETSPPVVVVFTDNAPLTIVHIDKGDSIRKSAEAASENPTGTYWKSRTKAEFDFKSSFGIAYDPDPKNKCFQIKTIEINFDLRKHEVYLPSEYAVGSCPYRALLDHETKHVESNNQLVRDYASYMDDVVRTWAKTLGPIAANNSDEASGIVSEKVGKLIDPILVSFAHVQNFRTLEINNREYYEKNQDRCTDW